MFYIFQGLNWSYIDIRGKIIKMVFISEMLIDVYITQEPRTCKSTEDIQILKEHINLR